MSLITLTLVFGGAMLGMFLRTVLPENHLNQESKDVVKLGVGLIATMAALVLGLLIASAKSSFDMQNSEITEMSSRVVFLDRILARYGPEAADARQELRKSVDIFLNLVNAKDAAGPSGLASSYSGEALYEKVRSLTPKDDSQRSVQGEALSLLMTLGQTRWLLAEQTVNSVSLPMLTVLVFWLTIIFVSFGLFAPRNTTVIVTLLVSAMSVSGAIYLILEMYSPYSGMIRVSTAPLQAALSHLGR
ncbi:MAG: hypothetical protein WA823_09615 [Candidatus Acidiferrales bacterium]